MAPPERRLYDGGGTLGSMIALIQRVTRAEVRIGERVSGAIGRGILALVGVTRGDDRPVGRATAGASARPARIFRMRQAA